MTGLLLCGGTGGLGRRIATSLAERGTPFRALIRPTSDTSTLRELGAQCVVGDLTDRAGLDRALTGTTTVVTTANAIGRLLAGMRGPSIEAVDRDGNAALVRAAEAAGVQRFVFVSAAGLTDAMVAWSAFAAAKRQTEEVLRASPMPSVIVRPAPFQELWLSRDVGLRADRMRAVILGRGRTLANYVSADDVAEACVRVATADAPPPVLDVGGPEALSRHDVVDTFERELGVPFRRIPVPRAALAVGARALRGPRPDVAAMLGMSLVMDLEGVAVGPEALRALGIEPRATTARIAELARGLSRAMSRSR